MVTRKRTLAFLTLIAVGCAAWLVFGELSGAYTPHVLVRSVPGDFYTVSITLILTAVMARLITETLFQSNHRLQEELQARKLVEGQREALIEELQNKNIQAEILRETTTLVASTLEQTETVERILEQLKRVVQYDSASVWLYRGEVAEMVGWVNLPVDAIAPGSYTISENEPDYALHVDENLDYILFDDIQDNYPQFQGPSLNYIRSWMAIPLRARGKLNGFIALDGHKPKLFTETDAQLALTFANQVSITLENARLVSDLQTELLERKQAEHALKFSEESI